MRRRARRASLVPDIWGCSGNIVNETVRAFGAIVGARHASPANTEEDYMQRVSRSKGLLSVVVGNFKSAITHFANIHNIGFAWQRSYHEHIIRDADDFNRIAEYIRMNPLRWAEDEYNNP